MIPYGGGSASQRVILEKEGIPIAVLTVHHEFEDVVVTSRTLLAVISSEARNPGQKNKISQSQPLTLFETRSFEMTEVDLWRLSGGGESDHTLDEAALIPTEISRTRIKSGLDGFFDAAGCAGLPRGGRERIIGSEGRD